MSPSSQQKCVDSGDNSILFPDGAISYGPTKEGDILHLNITTRVPQECKLRNSMDSPSHEYVHANFNNLPHVKEKKLLE